MLDALEREVNRRDFLRRGGALLAATVFLGPGATVLAEVEKTEPAGEDVAPPEDLMREHGALNRVLLIYEELVRRLGNLGDFPSPALQEAAAVIKTFIEDYHERLEEEHLFPRFEKAGKLTDLVGVLRQQHAAGRRITDELLVLSRAGVKSNAEANRVRDGIGRFIRMYRPHEAREDTVLFPALRGIVSKNEFDGMGEDFEREEHRLFGADGFEGVVARIAGIEKTLGIEDLSRFTPR